MIQKQIDEAISLNEIEFDVPVYFTDLCINPDIVNHKDYEHIIKNSYHESDESKMNLLYPINLHKSFHPILYFNPTKYPPSTEKFKKKGTFKILWLYLQDTFKQHGMKITIKGKHSSLPGPTTRIICYRCRKHTPKKKDPEKEYRHTNLINDKAASRGISGLKEPKRRGSGRAADLTGLCNFSFVLGMDSKGYFIHNGYGNSCHKNHFLTEEGNLNFTTKHFTESQVHQINDLTQANASAGAKQHFIYNKTGRILSLHNIRSLCQKFRHALLDPNDPEVEEFSSADNLIQYFKSNGFDYYCLLHSTNINSELGIYTENCYDQLGDQNIATSNAIPNFITQLNPKERKDLLEYIYSRRNIMSLGDNQHLMVAVAWVTKLEKRMFYLYPEVIFIDCTSDTNKEKRSLCTITGKNAHGKMFTILRAFLPNERAWMFRWLFSIVFPNSFEPKLIKRINYMITDGDPQEFQQLDMAAQEHFPQAVRGRCGYHLASKGFQVFGPQLGKKELKANHWKHYHAKIIIKWIYSWMKPGVNTKKQYIYSKSMLRIYLDSEDVLNDVGEEFVEKVKKFVKENIEPHQNHFLFYMRKDIRQFEEYSNSPHEGTNNGLKVGANCSLPNMLLDNASKRLSDQGTMKYEQFMAQTIKEQYKIKPWNPMKCATHLIDRAAALLYQQWEVRDCYYRCRVNENTWYLIYKEELRKPRKNIEPIYQDVHILTVVKNILYCSCYFFNRIGLPCRHMYNLLQDSPKYTEPSHHEVSVRWWSPYAKHAFPIETEKRKSRLTKLIEKLAVNDIKGPKCYIQDYEWDIIVDDIPEKFSITDNNFCLNYKVPYNEVQNNALNDIAFGMTQISHKDDLHSCCSGLAETEVRNNIRQHKNEMILDDNQIPKNIWHFFSPLFKELVSSSEGVVDRPRLDEISKALKKEINTNIQIASDQKKVEKPKGTIISSEVACSRKRKTHGTQSIR